MLSNESRLPTEVMGKNLRSRSSMLLTASSSMPTSTISFRSGMYDRTDVVFIETCYESSGNECCAQVKTGPNL